MTRVPRLLLITDRTQTRGRPLEAVVAACVGAGFTDVLLRERDLSPASYDELLARTRTAVGDRAVILTRDARPDSPGCHLPEHAPAPAGTALMGRSVHDTHAAQRARADGAAFVLAGPYAPTASKPGYGPALGLRGMGALVAAADGLPVLAVGGIRPADLRSLAGAGIAGAAVMGALMRATDPSSLAREYVSAATTFDDLSPGVIGRGAGRPVVRQSTEGGR